MDQAEKGSTKKTAQKSRVITVIAAVVIGVVIILSLSIGLSLGLSKKSTSKSSPYIDPVKAEEYKNAAVATDAPICSEIGRDILKKGGSAADGAIASLICCGVYNMHSTGIAGGGFMVFYNSTEKKGYFYDYRETGPASLRKDSYNNDSQLALVGGLAVGVPGEVRGLRLVWSQHGKLPWKDLIQPSIDLARNGFKIGPSLGYYLEKSSSVRAAILKNEGLREILVKDGGAIKVTGDFLKDEKYAKSLEAVRDNPESMYTGELARQIVADVNSAGGQMTLDDLKNYEVKTSIPLMNTLGDYTMFTSALPGGGPVLTHILNMIEGYNYGPGDMTDEEKVLFYHRAVESFKFSYSYRPLLGDPNRPENLTKLMEDMNEVVGKKYAKRDQERVQDNTTHPSSYYNNYFTTNLDQGTSHVSVLDQEGNAVAATDTINYILGAKFRSTVNGMTYNNELGDFFRKGSYPDKYPLPIPNAPGPGKRPLSSTCPTILTNKDGKVIMIAGASGGTKITFSTAWVIMRKLWFGMELGAAVAEGRPQHTFFPEYIANEVLTSLPTFIQEGLKKKGHEIRNTTSFAVVQAIYADVKNQKIFAKSDPRKGGKSAGY